MRSTRGKANKQCKFMQFILAPLSILAKARDFYVKSISDLTGGVGYGGMAGCPATPSFGLGRLASSKASNDKELRELIRSVSKRSMGSKVELNTRCQPEIRRPALESNGVRRSYSVGIGRISRIDEEKPCEFVEETDLVYPRSKSHAVRKRNLVY